MDVATARARFTELRGQSHVDPAELDQIWAALDTVKSADIVGHWKGDEFQTGHKMNGQLQVSAFSIERSDSRSKTGGFWSRQQHLGQSSPETAASSPQQTNGAPVR